MPNPQSIRANPKFGLDSAEETMIDLRIAACKNDLDKFKILFETNKMNVDYRIQMGRNSLTFLHVAAIFGADKIAEYLIKNNADIHSPSLNRDTALHIASGQPRKSISGQDNIEEKYLKIAKLLIEAGADLKAKGEGDKTPYDIARHRKNHKLIEFLSNKSSEKALSSMEVEFDSGARANSESDRILIQNLLFQDELKSEKVLSSMKVESDSGARAKGVDQSSEGMAKISIKQEDGVALGEGVVGGAPSQAPNLKRGLGTREEEGSRSKMSKAEVEQMSEAKVKKVGRE